MSDFKDTYVYGNLPVWFVQRDMGSNIHAKTFRFCHPKWIILWSISNLTECYHFLVFGLQVFQVSFE